MFKKSLTIILSLVSIIIGFVLIETILNSMYNENKTNKCLKYQKEIGLNHIHSMKFAKYKSNYAMYLCSKDFEIKYISDEYGYLGYKQIDNINKDLLVFGDSFAYGFGNEQNKTIAANLGAYNAGLWGRSYNDHAKVFGYITKKIKFKQAIWFLYPPHLITLSKYAWHTNTNVVKENKILYWIIQKYNTTELSKLFLKVFGIGWNRSDYYTPEWSLYDNEDKREEASYKLFIKAVKNIKQIAKEKGIKLTFLVIPSKNELRLRDNKSVPLFKIFSKLEHTIPANKMTKIIKDNNFNQSQIIYVKDIITKKDNWNDYYFDNDAHINELGSKLISKHISGYLNYD